MQRMPLVRSIEGYASQLEIPLVEENYYLKQGTIAVKLSSIKGYWIQLTSIGPKNGYFPKESKSYLTVK